MRKMKTLSALVLAVGLSVAALTSCSAGAASAPTSSSGSSEAVSGQTVAEACAAVGESVTVAQNDAAVVSEELAQGDFSAVAERLRTLHEGLQASISDVGNAQARTALETFAATMDDFAGLFEGVADGDIEALAGKLAEVQAVVEEASAAGQAWFELCS